MRGKLIGSPPRRRILVTGAPRSATTFVGRALAWPPAVDYLHEPLNPQCGLPSLDIWYADLGSLEGEQGARLRAEYDALLRYEPMLHTGYYDRDQGLSRFVKPVLGSRGPFMLRLARVNPFTRAVVVKDPFAVFSIGALVDRWDFDCVALVRHPVALAASVARLGWSLDGMMSGLAAQPALLDRLDPADREAVEARRSGAGAAALLWRITAREIVRVGESPRVRVVTHEAVNDDPVGVFGSLYRQLGLPWSRRVERRVRRATTGSRSEAAGGRTQDFSRNSSALLDLRLGDVDPETASRIWDEVVDVADRWYTRDGVREPAADA